MHNVTWCLYLYWRKEKRTPISTLNSIIVKTSQRNCLVWVKSVICHFSSVQQTIKYSKVNNGFDKLCASCNHGLRWVILACGMSPHTAWITWHNCTMVSDCGSRDLIWQSVRSLADAWWGTGWWACWPGQCMDCMWSSDVLCEADWERKCVVP